MQFSTKIIELENRCTGNRTVGSNPTLSAMLYRIYVLTQLLRLEEAVIPHILSLNLTSRGVQDWGADS